MEPEKSSLKRLRGNSVVVLVESLDSSVIESFEERLKTAKHGTELGSRFFSHPVERSCKVCY